MNKLPFTFFLPFWGFTFGCAYTKRNPVNTDTKGTGQIVRINGVSVLSGVSEKKLRIHFDLLEQLIDVDNNPAIRTEAVGDSGKQRTSKRKNTTSDGCSKRQRK